LNDFSQQLDSSLSELVPAQRVESHGAWSTSRRRSYASASQQVPGIGPYVEVVDARWTGELTADFELSAIAFLATAREIFWAKAPVVAMTLPVQIVLSAYADSTPGRATFTASLGGAVLPGVPIGVEGRLEDVCTLVPQLLATGRVTCLAETSGASFFAIVLPREVLKIGRNHLWRLREDLGTRLPATVRELLTRRRAGTINLHGNGA
jgi:hypothetical protein